MRPLARVAMIVAAGTAAGVAAAVAAGSLVWNRGTRRTNGRLLRVGDARRREGEPFSREQLEGLPPPVTRYFEFALTPGQRLVRRAHLRFTGTFAARPRAWAPFTARQQFTVSPPGFVWDATIRMNPLMSVRVRDSYIAGEGAMLAKLAALVPVADSRATPEMAAGALMRYLAEAAWFPTALLPGHGVSWTAVDDVTARLTLMDGPTTVSLDVRFDVGGEIAGMSAMRHRDVNGVPALTPWVVRHSEWKRVHGMMIPTTGEVAWGLPEGEAPYWRGHVVDAAYEW